METITIKEHEMEMILKELGYDINTMEDDADTVGMVDSVAVCDIAIDELGYENTLDENENFQFTKRYSKLTLEETKVIQKSIK